MKTTLGISLGLAIALLLPQGAARAGLIGSVSASVSNPNNGVWTYTYTVTDAPSSTQNIGEFDLSLTNRSISGNSTPAGAPITGITMQAGFVNNYTTGDPIIMFQSTDTSTDIKPGGSAVFSFMSIFGPSNVAYQLSSFDTGNSIAGTTFGPATTPEPSSLLMAGGAAIGIVGLMVRSRRRKA